TCGKRPHSAASGTRHHLGVVAHLRVVLLLPNEHRRRRSWNGSTRGGGRFGSKHGSNWLYPRLSETRLWIGAGGQWAARRAIFPPAVVNARHVRLGGSQYPIRT